MAQITLTEANKTAAQIIASFTNGSVFIEVLNGATIAALDINSLSASASAGVVTVSFDNVSTGVAAIDWVPADGALLVNLYDSNLSQSVILEAADYTLNREEFVAGEPVEVNNISITIPYV